LTNILTINETVEPLFPSGSGADPIVVIGDCGFAKDTSKVYFFGNYGEAKKDHDSNPDSIGPEPVSWSSNPALKQVRDIFAEGAIRTPDQTIGINQVYVINVGSAPLEADYTAAMETAATLPVTVENYANLSTVTVLDAIGTRMDELEDTADYRNAIGTVADGAISAKDDMIAMTDESENDYAQNSRVHIHTNPDMQGTYAAKVACTPYYQDPGYGGYRSKITDDIVLWKKGDRDELKDAGLVVDAPNLINPILAEPYMAVSTGYKEVGGVRPVDSLLHIRRNADHQWRQTDLITLRMVKMNNTAVAKGLIEQVANAYLKQEVENGYLTAKSTVPIDPGFLFELTYDPIDPFKLNRLRKVRCVGSVQEISDTSVIQLPIGGG
jgi:hypothetical protein